jgi:hypothetical protein
MYSVAYGLPRTSTHRIRRHTPECARESSDLKHCKCPLWARGRLHDKPLRRSLGTRSLQQSRKKIQNLLDERPDARRDEPAPEASTISAAMPITTGFWSRTCAGKNRLVSATREPLGHSKSSVKGRWVRTVDQMNLSLFEQYLGRAK